MNITGFVWDATRCVYWPAKSPQARSCLSAKSGDCLIKFRDDVYRPRVRERRARRIFGWAGTFVPQADSLSYKTERRQYDEGTEHLQVSVISSRRWSHTFSIPNSGRNVYVHLGGQVERDETGVFFVWCDGRGRLYRDYRIEERLSEPPKIVHTLHDEPGLLLAFQDGPCPYFVSRLGRERLIRPLHFFNERLRVPWVPLNQGSKKDERRLRSVFPPFALSTAGLSLQAELLRCEYLDFVEPRPSVLQFEVQQIVPLYAAVTDASYYPFSMQSTSKGGVARDFLIEDWHGSLSQWHCVLWWGPSPHITATIKLTRLFDYETAPNAAVPGTTIDRSEITVLRGDKVFRREQTDALYYYRVGCPKPISFERKTRPPT